MEKYRNINEYNNLINRLYGDNVKTLDGDNLDKYFKLTAGYPSYIFRDKEINFYYFRNFDIDRVGGLEVVINYKETKETKKIAMDNILYTFVVLLEFQC